MADLPAQKVDSSSQKPFSSRGIADILVAQGALSPEQLKEVKMFLLERGESEEEVIRKKRLVSPQALLKAKAEYLKVSFVDLDKVGFSPQSFSLVSRNIAQHYSLVPFDLDPKKKTLSVAMANPLDLETIEFLEKKTEHRVIPFLAAEDQIDKAIKEGYSRELTEEVSQALKDTEKPTKQLPDLDHLDQVIKEAPIAKVVSTILEFAMRSRASDVHIEPEEEETRVRYRVDGILSEKLVLPRRIHDAVISRIKILSNLKIDEKRVPQDGRFSFISDGQEVDLRVSTAPTVYGEKIVMRLLKKSQKIPDLPGLGLRGKALTNLQISINRPHGMIAVCGPTGSGKTTTLYSALTRVNTAKVNIMTIEDPVEYKIAGVNQVQINPQAGLTFSSALRSFLRQDPDIIMVGEIRDEETAALAVHAALTGHLVFSTLHTNDAAGAIPRLIDMGVEPFLLVSSLSSVVAQRILRQICPSCKEEYSPLPEVVDDIKRVLGPLLPKDKETKMTLHKGKGCSECNNTGYAGRIGIFEVFLVSDKIAKLVLEKGTAGAIQKAAVEEGMITMIQDGYLKALEGITTIEEVLRVAQY